jgi:hypothetical protein
MGNQTAVKKSAAKKPMAKAKSASTALGLNKKTASSAKKALKPPMKPAGKAKTKA